MSVQCHAHLPMQDIFLNWSIHLPAEILYKIDSLFSNNSTGQLFLYHHTPQKSKKNNSIRITWIYTVSHTFHSFISGSSKSTILPYWTTTKEGPKIYTINKGILRPDLSCLPKILLQSRLFCQFLLYHQWILTTKRNHAKNCS